MAVVADPVFGLDDDRLGARSGAGVPPPAPTAAGLRRAIRDLGLGSFGRLRETAREAEQILALVPPPGAFGATGFEASRETVAGGALAGFGTVHFATHGIAHPLLPELSGLVLSLVDRDGRPRDGFLRAHEIADLALDADLVVLSACRTGVGRRLAGEGPLALTRPFLHAGARRVVATYWDVDDQAAAELMTRFHRARLVDGLPDAAALRAARLSLRAEPRWSAPAHWAAFGLQGDSR
jgi:CHAT domain-containing protein